MEPERKIEKLLRAFGKKRREDAKEPFALHQANRRLLQGEVRKLGRARERGSNLRRFNLRQLIFASSAAAAFVILLASIIPALQPGRSAGTFAESAPTEMASAPAQEKGLPELDRARRLRAPAASPPPAAVSGSDNGSTSLTLSSAVQDSTMPFPASKGLVAAGTVFHDSFAPSDEARFYFRRVSNSAQTFDISALSNFTLMPTAAGVRIVDADGSVYEPVQSMDNLGAVTQGGEVPTPATPAAQSEVTQSQAENFRVAGTNLTLNQPLEFMGRLVVVTNALSKGSGDAASPAVLSTNVVGTIRVESRSIPIEAEPRPAQSAGSDQPGSIGDK